MFAGHDIKDISEGNEIEKNANIMSVSWRLPLVSEYPRKEKKKSGIEKSKPRKSADPRKKLMSDTHTPAWLQRLWLLSKPKYRDHVGHHVW